jgi:hypothetical protein
MIFKSLQALSKLGLWQNAWRWVVASALLLSSAAVAWSLWDRTDNSDILKIAYSYPDGGGYAALSDSGVPELIDHKGITILKPSRDGASYCCGFTFLIAMKTAKARGLLDDKEPYEVKRFQYEWYGVPKASRWRQAAMAMENLGIGREIDPRDARAGDFVVVHRVKGAGHSVIFLEWVRHNDTIVGFRYRSSQPPTNGVGDAVEYFATSGYREAAVDPKHFYVARLN